MVKTFVANIQNILDPKENPHLLDEFLQDRKEKILSHKNSDGRKQSFASSLLLKKILQQNNLKLQDVKYAQNKKPEIDGIFFNISHSDDFVICSTSKKSIGCDIEKIRPVKSGFENRFFTQNEVAYLNKFDGEEKLNQFFRLWTMKESYMKMTGEGMSLALNRFEFIFDSEIKVYRDGILCDCNIKEYDLLDHKISICAKENEFASNLEFANLLS